MNSTIHTSDNLFCSNSSLILELSVKCASQIFHENINKPLDGIYLANFCIGIELEERKNRWQAPESRYRRGFARLYQEHVSQANLGCDFDFLLGTPGETREPDIF